MNSEIMRVAYTHDGDTVSCWQTVAATKEARLIKIRLVYMDAPEVSQPGNYGIRARAYFRSLLYVNEPVEIRSYGQDPYGRTLAEVIRLRDYGNCGLRLVVGGYAALYKFTTAPDCYQAAQGIAKAKRAGIWKQPGPHQTPWIYRDTPS